MPSYNYARFLPTAIESVLDQSYEPFELLIVDNGSTDSSYEMALEYAGHNPRMRVLTHAGHENRGVNASLNLGLREARGAYFGLLPADDLYLPDSLERRVRLLATAPEAGFTYGTAQLIDEKGRPTGRVGGRSPEKMLEFDATGDLLQALLFHDFVPGASMLARRDLLTAIGGFDEAVFFNDWYVAMRLLARAGCVFVSGEPVVGYRLHERHRSEENRDADRPRRLELFRALSKRAAASDDHLADPRVRALIALQLAVHAYRLGELDEASAAVANAFTVDPLLRDGTAYVTWWLDPRHGEWSLTLPADERRAFLEALGSPTSSVDGVLAAGSDYTVFASLVLAAAADALGAEARTRIAWMVVAEQLEAVAAGPQTRVLASALIRAVRRPSLLRIRPFVKAALCAAGLWPLVARARRRASALAG